MRLRVMSGTAETAPAEVRTTEAAAHGVTRPRLVDAAFLALVTTIPAFFYTRGLGFYFDDHFFLGLMSTADDQSVGGLYHALTADPKSQLRPVEYFGLAVMYRLFGSDPLPYHILLAALVPLCALALYFALSQLGLPRYLSVTAPLLFAAVPHYSSDKFWPDAYSPTLTFALCLVSLYASLRAASTGGTRLWGWLVLATLAMLASIFMYEITLPLFALIVLYHLVRAHRDGGAWRFSAVALTFVLGASLIVKIVAAARLGSESSYSIGYEDGFLHHIAYLVSGAVKVNFGTYGIGLPYVLGWIFVNHLTWTALAAGALVGIGAFLYLARRADSLELPEEMPRVRNRPAWQYLAVAGLSVFIAGYGIFLVTTKIYFTSAGVDNRVNIISALGVVLIALALVFRALELVPAARRQTAFALVVALFVALGVFITTTIATYWQEAATRQREVLSGLRHALPADPSKMTVILDGTCPEIGPAIVFSAEDLTGALQTTYRNTNVQGVVATDNMLLERRGLVVTTHIYDYVVKQFFPYGPRLSVYDLRRRDRYPLASRTQAESYFAAAPRLHCPAQRNFLWGLHRARYLPFN